MVQNSHLTCIWHSL